ncbi:MAG: NADH-dependent [FeFe] hydrogenase, group A6 [Bacillota bacterium]|jgi:iron-only hydrogenase group A
MEQVTLTINGQSVTVPKGSTVLAAAKQAGFHIPTLCYMKDLNEVGACRVCVVEVEGMRGVQPSCTLKVSEGMVVKTNSPAAVRARRMNLELMLSTHPQDCLTCVRNGGCELQSLSEEMGIRDIRYSGERNEYPLDTSTPSIVRDPNKCILCRRCVAVCHQVQGVGVLGPIQRGFETIVAPEAAQELNDVACVLCGQCVAVCPTGALAEVDHIERVLSALADPHKHVVVQTAPAVRVAIGEEFGQAAGTVSTGQMVAGLRRLGFDAVFDTDFAADLTIWEEATELVQRLQNGGKLPLLTSCSPGWIKFIEHFYPDLLPHLSTCKSPQQMFGAVAKTYYAEKIGVSPEDIVVVSVMPCTAKKFESQRPEMADSGVTDVDAVLTTRELARMFKRAGINLRHLPEEEFDAPLGISTGAGVIFGASGGVMEAAVRTAYEWLTKQDLTNLELTAVRGLQGVKEAKVDFPETGIELKVAVVHSLSNARALLEAIAAKQADYHFVEVMACPGGCISGGGQPRPTDVNEFTELRQQRIAGIYRADEALPVRKSHENPAVKELYDTFLGEIGGEKAHHLLHTSYRARGKYPR